MWLFTRLHVPFRKSQLVILFYPHLKKQKKTQQLYVIFIGGGSVMEIGTTKFLVYTRAPVEYDSWILSTHGSVISVMWCPTCAEGSVCSTRFGMELKEG